MFGPGLSNGAISCYLGVHGRPEASRLMEPEFYVIPRALLKVKILSYKYKCKYKREVLFTVRKDYNKF